MKVKILAWFRGELIRSLSQAARLCHADIYVDSILVSVFQLKDLPP